MNFEYKHTMDAKNRLFIPAKFREQLGEEFVILKGPEKCLYVYSTETFERIGQQFASNNNRELQRSFFSQAADASTDKQGRVTLTADQVEHAGLIKDAVINGAGHRIEIWSAEEYVGKTIPMSQIKNVDDFVF